MSRRIAFINEKGGSGKTTLVANIGAYLASRRGRRTLAIDMDPQGQLGKALGLEVRNPRHSAIELLVDVMLGTVERAEIGQSQADARDEGEWSESRIRLPTVTTRVPNLDVVVANKALALFPSWLPAATGRPGPASISSQTQRLREALDRAPESNRYDYVLFDAPPSFGPLTLNILAASDEVVVPVPLTYLALDGCAELMSTIEMVRTHYGNPGLRVSMVIPTFHRRTRLAGEILEKLKLQFPKEVAHTVVGYSVKIDEAQSHGLSIFEYAPRDRGAQAMAALAEELDTRGRPPPEQAAPEPQASTRGPTAGEEGCE